MTAEIETITVDDDEGSSGFVDELFSADDDHGDVYIDLDSFWKVLGGPASPSEVIVLDDLSSIDVPQGIQNSKDTFSLNAELPGSSILSHLHSSEASDSRTGSSDGITESAGTSSVIVGAGVLEHSSQSSFVEHSSSRTVTDCIPVQENDHSYSRMVGRPQTPSSYGENDGSGAPSAMSSHYDPLCSYGTSHVTHDGESSADIHMNHVKDLFGSDDLPFVSLSSGFQPLAYEGGKTVNAMDEGENYSKDFISAMPSVDVADGQFGYQKPEGVSRHSVFLNHQMGFSYSSDMSTVQDESYIFSKTGFDNKVNINVKPVTSDEIFSREYEVADDIIRRKYYGGASKQPSVRGISHRGVQSNKVEHINLEDDSDVCILEDMSTQAVASNPVTSTGLFAASHFSTSTDPSAQMAKGHSRIRPYDERAIFQVAVQDLSQPSSEALPPDGLLSVSLMKHQRIALSWMVNKETKGACCSGGILADDQGLGKTISTIALILKERSPSSKASIAKTEQRKMEMCDLVADNRAVDSELHDAKSNLQTKSKPPGGTLIVCPTSVLRQWSEELHNKVTREADLSVLIYHGSNRTKNPLELAKYDVVITTYAIVSMEVPKPPPVNEKDDPYHSPFKGFSSDKKRKLDESASGKKSALSKKIKKQISNELLESLSGPLAKVGWFRVVLDEAQIIKNHRTQVARACWGLRAKRRWCLSGTPIQNAIDDLYSYFRFLRHDPYATFKTFCEHIKGPIHKNPMDGYKKLQAVLKTIMLRRTKSTCIDGEPILNLPPKTIELKSIDFSPEERKFYSNLEADSQAQFQEYAEAGTVKQNYVNILVMLLRLRQACDHPFLVRGLKSTSQNTSSIELAKKLPLENSVSLINCAEASLAVCGLCSDPPEDAVVAVCGHVFCNQCICEHMIGNNDARCPAENCKTRLSTSQISPITTIGVDISNNLNPNNRTLNCADSRPAKVSDSCSSSYPDGSSKIKAAMKILTSLSRPKDTAVTSSFLHGCVSVVKDETPDIKYVPHSSVTVAGEKAIVFSQWTKMLDLLEDHLKNASIQYRRLDGTMPIALRDQAVKDFTNLSEVSVIIMSLKAASLGLNLVAATHVIILDLWWNPTTEDQAIDRAHRIGQTRPVSVYRLTVNDTIEDRILELQEKKREMVASAFGEDENGRRQTRLTVDDLKFLFMVN